MVILTKFTTRVLIIATAIFISLITIALLSDLIFWVRSILKWGWFFPPAGYYQMLLTDHTQIYIHFGFPALILSATLVILTLIARAIYVSLFSLRKFYSIIS